MNRIDHLPEGISDVPVIFVRSPSGKILEKISINELKRRHSEHEPEENQRIKIYRAALDHYANGNYELAEILLKHLIEFSESINYEYYERLANLYRITQQKNAEIAVLQEAIEQLHQNAFPENLIQRVERRLAKLVS